MADLHANKAAGEKELSEAVAKADAARAKESAESQDKLRAVERSADETRRRWVQIQGGANLP